MEIFKSLAFSKMQIFIFALSLWLYWLWTRRHLYSFALKFPGQWGLPIIGSLLSLGGPNQHFQAFEKLFRECKRHTICIWMGLYPALLTVEPAIIEQVILSPDLLHKPKTIYSPLNSFFGSGILTSPVEKWQHNRRLLNPSFNHKVLVSFLPIFDKFKHATILKFDAMAGKGEQKLHQLLQRTQLEIAIETTMGKVIKEGDQEDENLVKQYSFAINAATIQMNLSFVKLGFIVTFYRRYVRTKFYLRNFVEQLAIQKLNSCNDDQENKLRVTNEKTPCNAEDTVMGINKTPKIFIDQAIHLYQKKQFNWEDLSSESNTIVATAFETTGNSTSSILIMLAMHPTVQDKLYQEILNVFPDKDFEMKYEHMQQLPYLDMVVNETLRIAPPAPFMARQVVKNMQLTPDLQLPAGLQIMIPIFNLNRSTDIWGPNANKFNPDNFLPENLIDKHSHAFIPFSKGARNCIGWRYGLFSIKTMIAGLVRNYRFTTTYKYEDLKYSLRITLIYNEEPGLEIHRR